MSEEERALREELHRNLCDDLKRIKKPFLAIGTPKVSLIIRFEDSEKGVWLTEDTAEEAIAFITRMDDRTVGGAL